MLNLLRLITTISFIICATSYSYAETPKQERKKLRQIFQQQLPGLKYQDYANGIYALNQEARIQQQAIESLPPYIFNLQRGKKLFETPFANGKTYASCFKNGGIGIAQHYPYFDSISGSIKTLAEDLNQCRINSDEQRLSYQQNELTDITAYMTSTSRGKTVQIIVPNDNRALQLFNQGKKVFYTKRGQLNFSCANCHVTYAGHRLRSELISPVIGQAARFPVYRAESENLTSLHQMYKLCMKRMGAKPYESQSDEFKALEYYHKYLSNGLKVNAPSYHY